MNRRIMIVFIIFIWSLFNICPIFCQTLGVFPNEEGQLNLSGELSWMYSSSPFGGGIRLKTESESEIDKESSNNNLDKSITTIENHIFIEAIPLYYSYKYDDLVWNPGIGIKIDWYEIQEVGYQDLIINSTKYRLFFNNEREIIVIRPGVYSGFIYDFINITTQFNLFYSPLYFVFLDQEFSSAAEGTSLLDTPITSHSYSGVGKNAWGGSLSIKVENEYLFLNVKNAWEGFNLEYDYIGIGGVKNGAEITNVTSSICFLTGFPAFSHKGFFPVIGLDFSWDITKDIQNNEDWSVQKNPVRVVIGINNN